MAVLLKCQDCGRTQKSEDGEPETCPECEGTMVPPAKKAYQAKSRSLEEESQAKKKPAADERARKKPAPRDEDEDEDDAPPPKKRAARAAEGGEGVDPTDVKTDGTAAEALELNPGFKSRALLKQVAKELSRTEVLHWAGRICPEVVEKQAFWARLVGAAVMVGGGVFCAIFFSLAPWFVGLVPVIFVLVGLGIVVFGPGVMRKRGALTWYAVTDQRAIVFAASGFGQSGETTTYEPSELRRMRVRENKKPKGSGDLIFKTKITERRTDYVDRRTGQTTRSETSRSETHYGFLGIEDVREVETLIHKVLLGIDDE